MKIIKMNIKRYKEIIRKKDILTRALSEARFNLSGMIIFKDPISLDSDVKIPLLSFTES